MTEEGGMTDHFSASKQGLPTEEEGKSRKRRYSQDKESSDTSSHLRREKRRKNRAEERRSHRRHRHTREEEKEGRSKSRTTSSSLETKRKRERSYSRERDSVKYSRTLNGYKSTHDRPSPRKNHKTQRYSPVRRYRSRSRSPVSRYEEDSKKTDAKKTPDDEEVRDRYRSRSRSPVRRYKWDSKRYESRFSDEEDVYDPVPRHSHGYPALKKEINDLLRIEHHHLAYEGKEDSSGDVQGVEWCYKYLDPTIRGHITGGRAILHHRCRQCNRICLHLLGKYGTGKRMCLACAARERGWLEEEVPSWYFHRAGACSHCKPRQNYFHRY